ncbi:MAG: NAD(P)-binding domain-containing protein, partial [Rhodospirillales bacterium]|nr:NAD(P)-binding domain-containing protein [Rhodospirillales bacterium]
MADQPNIGFIGIGNMGALMARNLIGAGFSVTVMDAVDGRAQEFAEIFGCEF